jgi:hypothetical protein
MRFASLVGIGFMLAAVDADAAVIAFDIPASNEIFTSATVDGFQFTSQHFHLIGDGHFASNGTTLLTKRIGVS